MPRLPAWLRTNRLYSSVGIAAVLLTLGFTALHEVTREIHLRDVRVAFHAIEPARIVLALVLTAASYAALACYDALALRVIGRRLPWRTVALGSFASYAVGNTLGLSVITGGTVRHRVYGAAGLDTADVARIMAIVGGTFWLGLISVASGALLAHPQGITIGAFAMSAAMAHAIGALVLVAVVTFVCLCGTGRRRLAIAGWRLPLPSARQAIAQIAVATIDLATAGTALFVLLPGATPALLPVFILAYALAIIGGMISHVPGGLGVFEAIVIAVLPTDKPALLAALVAYRVIYYLLPLGIAAAALAWNETHRGVGRTLNGVRAAATAMAPFLLSMATFVGGAVLLLSGALPAIPERYHALRDVVPLPFVNASHLAASLVGTALLMIAPGLYRRLDGAALLARMLLVAGAIFSLTKGIDYEEAAVCLTVAAALHWTRSAFYRRTELVARPLSPTWLLSVLAVLGLSIWIGLFTYKHVDYGDALWWQFAWHGNAPRFLRASMGACVLLAGTAIWRLFAAAPVAPAQTTDPADLQRLVALADRTEANLAFVGDKRLLFAADGDAALMYQVSGTSWIVMGNPVGNRDAWPDLLWRLRTMADAAQGRLLLYQVTADALEVAVGLGLQIVKYGEEAIVDIATFSLEGSRMRAMRQTDRRLERDGARFDIVPAAAVPAILPQLAAISDHWLVAKGHREKGFSLGRFDPDYITRFDCAVVRVSGRIVAFGNVWATPEREELSIDLMRHDAAAPSGTMDFLFTRLLAWGAARGYARFSLGLAPLSGIDGRRLAPTWAKAAALLFRHGERLYGFRGLRAYKEKFAPRWEPRFIAGPAGIGMLRGLRDLNTLIGHPAPALAGGPGTTRAPDPASSVQDVQPDVDRPDAKARLAIAEVIIP